MAQAPQRGFGCCKGQVTSGSSGQQSTMCKRSLNYSSPDLMKLSCPFHVLQLVAEHIFWSCKSLSISSAHFVCAGLGQLSPFFTYFCTEKVLASLQQRQRSVIQGMLQLHSHKPPILHRDLKSPNLLVDKHWRVKVTDFNLSSMLRLDADSAGLDSSFANNPRWLAPEVCDVGCAIKCCCG